MIPPHANIAVVANGECGTPQLKDYDVIVAVDGGLLSLDRLGITPHLITGDFDSAPATLLEKYKSVPRLHTPDQNESDVEKALTYLMTTHPEHITLFGATGKRLDHTLYNLHLVAKYAPHVTIESPYEIVQVIDNDRVIKCAPGQTLSFFAWQGEATVTTHGLQWELTDATLSPSFSSLSNRALHDMVHFRIHSGTLLLCLKKSDA